MEDYEKRLTIQEETIRQKEENANIVVEDYKLKLRKAEEELETKTFLVSHATL